MTEYLANFAESTLASSITSSSTTLTVASGQGAKFPTTGNFRVRVGDGATSELVMVTSRSGDVLTTSVPNRGIEQNAGMGAAQSHASGEAVRQVLTAGGLAQIMSETAGHSRLHNVEDVLDHSYSGLAVGEVLSADSATTASFQTLLHAELGTIGTDDHHAALHTIGSHSGSLTPTSTIYTSVMQIDDDAATFPYTLTGSMVTVGQLSIAAAEIWIVEIVGFLSASGDGQDIRVQWSLPSNVTHISSLTGGIEAAATTVAGSTATTDYGVWTTSTHDYGIDGTTGSVFHMVSRVKSTSGSGTCNFQAQQVAAGGIITSMDLLARRAV